MLYIIHIGNEPFKISYMDFNADRYEEMLEEKIAKVVGKLPNAIKKQLNYIDIIRSPVRYFRQRCRFAISHRENFPTPNERISDFATQESSTTHHVGATCPRISSAAVENNEILPVEGKGVTEVHLAYTLWENGGPNVDVDSFPIASRIIYDTMPIILKYLQTSPELHTDLRAINFLSTLSGDLIATLVYDCKLDCLWEAKAVEMHETLEKLIPGLGSLGIIGRSHGVCTIIKTNSVKEVLHLSDGRELTYVQVEGAFSNPNARVNEKALDWICSAIRDSTSRCLDSTATANSSASPSSSSGSSDSTSADRSSSGTNDSHSVGTYCGPSSDLLELYCGNGNHTVAIAAFANRVVAVELNKTLCSAAEENLLANNVHNVHVIPCDSEQFAKKILREKCYTLKSTGEVLNFKTVLVDPPRAGLDPSTLRLVGAYESIVYISCSGDSLARDLEQLCLTHDLQRYAVFDQFAYTPHIECGVYLTKRTTSTVSSSEVQ